MNGKKTYRQERAEITEQDNWNKKWWYFCACKVCHDRDKGKTTDRLQPVDRRTCSRHAKQNGTNFTPPYVAVPQVSRLLPLRMMPMQQGDIRIICMIVHITLAVWNVATRAL